MKTIYIILILGLFLKPLESFAWGKDGHRIVAEIAKSQLRKSIQDSVSKYLGVMSFDDAATWMDDVRGDASFDFMKPWHFIDIEKGQTYVPKPGDQNCYTELQRVINELKTKKKLTKDQITTDIKVLFHLCGDIAQPLHTGYPEDKGGNNVNVSILSKTANLHHVWDSDIIYYKKITAQTCIVAFSKLTKVQLDNIRKIDVLVWMNDSRALLPEVYTFQKYTIDENYIDKNVPVIEKQLFDAGIRLGAVLNSVFSK